MTLPAPLYTAGSKTISVHDDIDAIDFQTWLLYPSSDTPRTVMMGPYPIDACPEGDFSNGKFPLVIISHGGGGSHLLYRTVALHLARNGYFVAMPRHHQNNRDDNSLEGQNINLTLRSRHISQLIDALLTDPELSAYIDPFQIFMIGHSMGGCAALTIAGAVPWSEDREKIDVTHDKRVKALALFAPAAAWFQHPDSFNRVNLPMLVYTAEHDAVTPYWQAELIKQKANDPELVTVRRVENAGHFSFLAPFPATMANKSFPPSQDPEGFDRVAFHEILKADILSYFNQLLTDETIF